MEARRRDALIAVTVLIVVPATVIVAWRALRGPAVLVSYVRSGGLAGTTQELIVFRDRGTLLTADGSTTERRLTQDELDELEEVLGRGDWPAEPTTYGRPTPDDFQMDIAYDGHSVRAYFGQAPPWLDAVISELDRLVAERSG